MRIGLVITELDPGGAELCLTELALYLSQQGHAISVWALGPPPRDGQRALLERLTQAGISVQFGNARGTRDAWRIARWLRRSLDAFRPDIVQSMLWHANLATGWALWTSRTPWVAGMRVSEPRSGRWWLERMISSRMQHMVCVSRETQRHATEKERITPSLVSVIPNGIRIPLSTTAPVDNLPTLRQLGLPTNAPAILFVGRLEAQKGLHELSQRLPEILRRLTDWQMIFVGDGSLRGLLTQRIASYQLADRAHVVGWQANARQWMSASQILILPAIYEGMPNVVLEAMALAKPFAAFAVDGVEQLVDTDQGYPAQLASVQTAEPHNWPQLIDRIETLASSSELRAQCGLANQAHVSQHFRLEDQLRKYEELYLSILKGKS